MHYQQKHFIFIFYAILICNLNQLYANHHDIIQAALAHNGQTLQTLLDNGIDLNAQDHNGDTALMQLLAYKPSTQYDQAAIIHALKFLLNFDVDFMIKNNDNENFLNIIVRQNKALYNKILDFLLASKKLTPQILETKDSDGNTLLLQAARYGNDYAVNRLYLYRANIHALNNYGYTALGLARRYKHGNIAGFLVRHGAQVERGTPTTEPIFVAAFDNNLELLEKELNAHGDVNIQNKNLETPLFIAATHGNIQAVQYLLSKGANPNITNQAHLAPLLQAILLPPYEKNLELIKLLVAYNADLKAQDTHGHTACTKSTNSYMKDFMRKYCSSQKNKLSVKQVVDAA